MIETHIDAVIDELRRARKDLGDAASFKIDVLFQMLLHELQTEQTRARTRADRHAYAGEAR